MVLEKERKKKTRIVCTIGPASEDKKVLTKLVIISIVIVNKKKIKLLTQFLLKKL